MSVECVGFSRGSFRWAASGGLDKTLKVTGAALLTCDTGREFDLSLFILSMHPFLLSYFIFLLQHLISSHLSSSSLCLTFLFPPLITSHHLISSLFILSMPSFSFSFPHRHLFSSIISLHAAHQVWDIATGSCRSVCPHGDSVVSLKWHSSLPIISTAALDHIVRVWDARAGN